MNGGRLRNRGEVLRPDEAKAVMDEFERGELVGEVNEEVWVVADVFVMEPAVCGLLLGEVHDLDMHQFRVVRQLSQAEFDALVEEYFAQNGHPDT
jgi:hypothetical protein